LDWRISGTYLESCNCDAICPCRRIGGRTGGRSTYGICLGALSWLIEEGHAGDVDLSGLAVALASRYDDDEEGSPWSYYLYLDERGDERQHKALQQIYTGQLGGDAVKHFPWAWKPSHLLDVIVSPIDVDHTPGRGRFRVGRRVVVRVRGPVEDQETVTCVIPGHHRTGREIVAEELAVREGVIEFELDNRCGYESTFEYSSGDQPEQPPVE
jgi:hypothetical protein